MSNQSPAIDINSATADSAVGQEMVERIVSEGQMLAIDLPENVNDLKDWLIQRENQLAREAAKQGFGFLALKAQIPVGEFKQWLKDNSLSERRTYELMNIAQMLLDVPAQVRRKLIATNKSKLIELARITPEDVVHAEETGKLDDLLSKTHAELRRMVRTLEDAKNQKDAEKNTEKAKKEKLEALLDMRRDETAYPDFYLVAREESRALTQKIEMCLDDLHSLVQEEFQRSRSPELSDEVREYADNALGTLFIHITGLAGRFTKLGHTMERSLGREITENMGSELRYSPAEAAEVVARHDTLMAEHRLAAQQRADAREEAKPRGRGRPKKKA